MARAARRQGRAIQGEGWGAMGGVGGLIALYGESGMLGPHHLGTRRIFCSTFPTPFSEGLI